MSIESMTLALHHSRAKGTTKLVLLGIANHDGDGGAWPSVSTLAKYANVDARTVRRSIRDLVALGEVSVSVQAGGVVEMADYARPNRYEVLVRCPEGCDRSAKHRVTTALPPDVGVTPPPDADVIPRGTPTSAKPSYEPPVETSEGRSSSPPPAEPTIPGPRRAQRVEEATTDRRHERARKAIADVLPGKLYRGIPRRVMNDLIHDALLRGMNEATLHLAIRAHDWATAETPGAAVRFLEDVEPLPASKDCPECKGTGYWNPTGGYVDVIEECECLDHDERTLAVPGIDTQAG